MLRPIPPHVAWKAIAALAGSFTLVSALGAPVDLWRLTVKSHQGEPFKASAALASLPEEHISDDCLSMGPESDAPGSEMPFLDKAKLTFDAARGTVEISTDEPVGVPALALVVRVQCVGAPLYARHFSALIPPALAKPPVHRAAMEHAKRPGFHLKLLPGDSVESVAAVIFPGNRGLQQDLVQKVLAGNPNVFVNRSSKEVPAGTVLWFPDLREIRNASRARSGKAAKSRAAADMTPAENADEPSPKARKPVTLRRALQLGDKPGPQECSQLMRLCGIGAAGIAVPPALGEKAQALESGVKELHLKQEGIDQQLQRLEQSMQTLQRTVASAPAVAQPLVPPKVEVRTVVRSAPLPWYVWLGLAALVLMAGLGGFAYGRRGSLSRGLTQTDEQLDRMLATAATVMRELETPRTDVPSRVPARPQPPPAPSQVQPSATTQPVDEPASALEETPSIQQAAVEEPATEVDFPLESEPLSPPEVPGLSSDVLYEMDQALDNTRSMFTDVDRFIALGRTQNALSLLQFQVHKDPKDRDSWIKLMAIYRQEKMDVELARAVLEFRTHFPDENPPGGSMLR